MPDPHYRRLVILMMLATLVLTAWGVSRPPIVIEQPTVQGPEESASSTRTETQVEEAATD
jgi:hypothetical protein